MPKTIEQYLEMGLDRKMAEYYASGRKKVTAVSPRPDFTLLLTFNNGEQRILDMKPALETGGVFTIFRKYENFQRVYLDDCGDVSWDIDPNIDSNVVWNNKVDICPDGCYVDSVPLDEWDPDYTKVTPSEAAALQEAEKNFENGEYYTDSEINWD